MVVGMLVRITNLCKTFLKDVSSADLNIMYHFLRYLIHYSLQFFTEGILSLPIQIMGENGGPSESFMGSKASVVMKRLGIHALYLRLSARTR